MECGRVVWFQNYQYKLGEMSVILPTYQSNKLRWRFLKIQRADCLIMIGEMMTMMIIFFLFTFGILPFDQPNLTSPLVLFVSVFKLFDYGLVCLKAICMYIVLQQFFRKVNLNLCLNILFLKIFFYPCIIFLS